MTESSPGLGPSPALEPVKSSHATDVVRGLLILTGIGFGLWGLWLMRDFTRPQLTSEAFWFAGGVVLHDAVLAPIVVVIGFVASRRLPGHFRGWTATAFLIWGTLTIAFLPTLSGEGGKLGNHTILGKPYVLTWLILTVVLAVVAFVAARVRRRRLFRATDG